MTARGCASSVPYTPAFVSAQASIMDSQSVKSTQESVGSNGYDAHKNVVGRKRHILVDTLGLSLSVLVTPADVQTVPAHGV